jgi:hypothetical protein
MMEAKVCRFEPIDLGDYNKLICYRAMAASARILLVLTDVASRFDFRASSEEGL